jgi:hypothetical protein
MADVPTGSIRDGRAARVTRTGLALVHEGELVLPSAGSEAQAETVAGSDRTAVHYHFPVEVQVLAGADSESLDRLSERIFAKLMHAADSLNTG